VAPYQLDASKCISYFTIELKDAIPTEVKGQFENWAFGCDICQEVCPWNRFSTPHNEPEFAPTSELMQLSQSDWNEITEEVFNRLFEASAVQRTGFKGLKRNLAFLK
jgi:epoxyqueuosine reductase